MTEEIRRLLDEELAEQKAPPLGDLVRDSVRQGRRLRRRRRQLLGSSSAAFATVLLLVVALASWGQGNAGPAPLGADQFAAPPATAGAAPEPGSTTDPGPPPDPACTASPGPSAAKVPALPDDVPGSQPEAGRPGVPAETPCPTPRERLFIEVQQPKPVDRMYLATPAGTLELLDRILAKNTSGHAVGETSDPAAGATYVQIYVDRGKGPAMIRFSVSEERRRPDELTCEAWETCYPLDDGGELAISDNPENCVAGRGITLRRADGILITANLARCLMWNGSTNPPAPVALSTQEAVDLVLDPLWGTRMPAEIVLAGTSNFPNLPSIQGG